MSHSRPFKNYHTQLSLGRRRLEVFKSNIQLIATDCLDHFGHWARACRRVHALLTRCHDQSLRHRSLMFSVVSAVTTREHPQWHSCMKLGIRVHSRSSIC